MRPDAFHATRWTIVRHASGDSAAGRAALCELCAAYYGPVVAFLRRESGDEQAREIAHEFFAALLENPALGGAKPGHGRFLSYLLGAVKHFLTNRRRDAAREKRGGGAEHTPLGQGTDTSPGVEVADVGAASPDADFDREWALAVVERALAALQAESDAAGQAAQFSALKPWLTPSGAALSQASVAAEMGLSEGAVKVAIHRLRRRFRELVRAEIAQTMHDPANLDDEMRHLVEALSR